MPTQDKGKPKRKKSAAKSGRRKHSRSSSGHHHRHRRRSSHHERKSLASTTPPPPPAPPPACDSLTMLNWMMYTHKYGENVYDAVQLLLTCPLHRKLALCGVGEQSKSATEDQKLYLPFYPIKHGQAWTEAAEQFVSRKLLRENLARLPAELAAQFTSGAPGAMISEPAFLELLRVQLPVYFDFNERVTYQIQLTAAACQAGLCADNNIIGWYRIGPDLPSALTNQKLFGPEMLLLMEVAVAAVNSRNETQVSAHQATTRKQQLLLLPEEETVREFAITDIFAFAGLEELRASCSSSQQANPVSKEDILRAYGDFLQHVSPSEFMVVSRFEEYLRKAGLAISAHVGGLYRAFAAKKRAFLDFEEFIMGLLIIGRLTSGEGAGGGGADSGSATNLGGSAALEPTTVEAEAEAEQAASSNLGSSFSENRPAPAPVLIEYSPETMLLMAEFLFRFYCTSPEATQLTGEQLARATKDLQLAEADVAALLNSRSKPGCSMDAFTSLLVEKVLPKSNLAAWPAGQPLTSTFELAGERTPLEQLHTRLAYPEIRRTERDTCSHSTVRAAAAKMRSRLLCDSCHRRRYTLAAHHVKLDSSGLFYAPTVNTAEDVSRMSSRRRHHEASFFRESFVCNQILDMIRRYARAARIFPTAEVEGEVAAAVGARASSGKRKSSRKRSRRRRGGDGAEEGRSVGGGSGGGEMADWSKRQTKRSYARKILSLCEEVRELIASGPSLLKVASPCYVFGDIHGNLCDLLTYDMNVWRSNVYFFSANLLFLGDYVDRGPNSVECILYLLCLKAIAPTRVHLLRGNHETRQLQREYTFHNEVVEKFGVEGDLAERIFEALNGVFDVLPLVAVVDDSIYCAHGGIPSQASLAQIATAIPRPLEAVADPSVANEILWNDPITDKEHADLMVNDPTVAANTAAHPDGFPANTRRGTACYFSEYALRRFLAANRLSHVIRAHECIPSGFWFHSGGNCVTIFSCSHYANGINDSAIALIFNSQILVIRMDTIAEQVTA